MFKQICEHKNLKERRFFTEKVRLFIRLTHVFAEKEKIEIPSKNPEINLNTNQKLQKLQIMTSRIEEDHKLLIKILKQELYEEFMSAINFSIEYKDQLGELFKKLDPSKRNIIQKAADNKNKPKVVDFFCGAGGLSLGFIQEGFQVELVNDIDDVCIETFKYNHPEIPDEKIILGDIKEIINDLEERLINEIDVVVGGPPCQGFSYVNQQRIIDDPRNELYKFFLHLDSCLGQ